MSIFFILLGLAVVFYIIAKVADNYGKKEWGEEAWEEFKDVVREEDQKKKYNNYMFTCPMCGSKHIKKIGDLNRATSVAVMGLASSKIGKQYECDSCKHKW